VGDGGTAKGNTAATVMAHHLAMVLLVMAVIAK
jgi:hypothetical protein